MRLLRRRIILFALAAVFFILVGCSSSWQYNPITDVNDLHGRSVGVNLSWESDYYLTGRTDLTLYRYDSTADMVMALRYDKVDALAVDDMMWKIAESLSDGLEAVEPAFGECGYLLYFSREHQALAEDFNQFLAEYKETEDYEDFLERAEAFDGEEYEGPEIELTGTGETLRVAYGSDGFPHTFIDPGMDVPDGYDLEALKLFANDRGYQLDFIISNYDDAVMGLQNGLYDIYVGYLSDVYREEVEAVGLFTSANLYESKLYFIQKTQADFSLNVEELE